MTYYAKVNTDIRHALFTDLILENHPAFYEGSSLSLSLKTNPAFFNMEHIIESMMAICSNGLYEFNDGVHQDYTDESDCKTGTLYANEGSSTTAGEISSVRSRDGVLKKGAIRAVIMNPILKKNHFFFIPKTAVKDLMTKKNGEQKKTKSICLRYNKTTNEFSTIDKYGIIEYDTFKELAMEKNR